MTNYQTNLDPEEFVVPAQDLTRRSVRVWFRIHPQYEELLELVLHSAKFPFDNRGDILRWCVHYGLKCLQTMCKGNKQFESTLETIDFVRELVRTQREHCQFIVFFRELSDTVNTYLSLGEIEEAGRTVKIAHGEIKAMAPGLWRTTYLAELDARYGNFLDVKDQLGTKPKSPIFP